MEYKIVYKATDKSDEILHKNSIKKLKEDGLI